MNSNSEGELLSWAIAVPSRRTLLQCMRLQPQTVTQLVVGSGLKQPNVSNHLAKLREKGIIQQEKVGRTVYYSLSMFSAATLLRYLDETNQQSITSIAVPLTEDQKNSLKHLREVFLGALLAGNELQLQSIVNQMIQTNVGIDIIYSQVFCDAMERIGQMYANKEIDESVEHLASSQIERLLAYASNHYQPIRRKPFRALVGCVEGNWHTLGVRMIADTLKTEGWEVYFLGANVPTKSFVNMVERQKPHLVIVACTMEEHFAETQKLTQLLQEHKKRQTDCQFQIVIGGNYFIHNPEALKTVQTDWHAVDINAFMKLVHSFETDHVHQMDNS